MHMFKSMGFNLKDINKTNYEMAEIIGNLQQIQAEKIQLELDKKEEISKEKPKRKKILGII